MSAFASPRPPRYAAMVLILTGLAPGPTVAQAPAGALAAPLCEVLRTLLPEVRGYRTEGARAQLVMAVGEKFDYDPEKLAQVRASIDTVTSASCPKERASMLGITGTKTLAEALQ